MADILHICFKIDFKNELIIKTSIHNKHFYFSSIW